MKEFDLENILIQAAKEQQIHAPDESWHDIKLAMQKDKKRRPLIWWWLLPALLIGGSIGYYLGSKNKPELNLANIKTTENNNNKSVDLSKTTQTEKLNTNVTVQENPTIAKQESQYLPIHQKPLNSNLYSKIKVKKENIKITKTENTSDESLKNKIAVDINQSEKETANNDNKTTQINDFETVSQTTEVALNDSAISNNSIINNKKLISNSDTLIKPIALVNKKQTQKPTTKKWKSYYAASVAALTISDKGFFGFITQDKSISNFSTQGITTLSVNLNAKANYTNASMQQLQWYVQQQNAKKIQLQLGLQLQYGSYNAAAYNANILNMNTGAVVLADNLQNGVSGFRANNTIMVPLNQELSLIENKFLQFGAVLGANATLIKVNQKPKVNVSIQLVPCFALHQNVFWFNSNSARFYKDQVLNRKLNLFSNLHINYAFKIGKHEVLAGPLLSNSLISLNKNNSFANPTIANAFGVKAAIRFNK
jgi:hypothetical protein